MLKQAKRAIIGGTGFGKLVGLQAAQPVKLETPFGQPSAHLLHGTLEKQEFLFLARHGENHTIPPHKVNYRANLLALYEAGVEEIVAIAAVGGITPQAAPAAVVIPNQIIDYTYGREHTFFNGEAHSETVEHIDFTQPYCESLRQKLLTSAKQADISVIDGGTYGATQGPRLETAAEIMRMERDGCDLVGMTGMPEASLARELGICYATCAVSANWAAGKAGITEITMEEIHQNLETGMAKVQKILIMLAQNRL